MEENPDPVLHVCILLFIDFHTTGPVNLSAITFVIGGFGKYS